MSARTREKAAWKNARANFVADPVGAAHGLAPDDIGSARTLHDQITAYHDDPEAQVPDGWDAAAAKARAHLEQLHPELRGRAFGEDREDELAPHEKRFHRSGHAVTRHGRNKPPAGPKDPRPERRGGQSRARSRAGSRRSSRGPASRAWQGTGVPDTVSSYRDLLLQVIGFGLLATLSYDLLTGKGPTAVVAATRGLGTFVRAIVAPVDPLHPGTAPTRAVPVVSAPATTPSGAPLVYSTRLMGYPDSHQTPTTPASRRAPLFTNPLAIPSIGATP